MSNTPNFDRIQPQTCINGKLRKLHRIINAAYQKKLKPYNLRGSMLSILFVIGKNKNINQKRVAAILVLDASTMSRDLKKLVNRGVVKVSKGSDPRHSELELTEQGFQLVEEIAPIWERLHHKVENILGQFNLQQINILTQAIHSNLEELEE